MSRMRVSVVDVYVLRQQGPAIETLLLRRSTAGRCAGAWEAVHGHIEDGETPTEAARREVDEETGLDSTRLYSMSRVELFYQHQLDEVALVPVFAAFVSLDASVRLSAEHDKAEWVSFAAARERLAWPRERRALEDLEVLFRSGNAGSLEDVLRVL